MDAVKKEVDDINKEMDKEKKNRTIGFALMFFFFVSLALVARSQKRLT